MKKVIIFTVATLFSLSTVFAGNFSPTLLKLSAPGTVLYQFDGSKLDIPVQVSGKPANLVFVVSTKGLAESVNPVRNGYLGWHYVNRIDTCVYVSDSVMLGVGSSNVSWNGKNDDGGSVPAGVYTYYLWAYDNVSSKLPVTRSIPLKRPNEIIVKKDDKGIPLSNPVIITGGASHKGTDQRQERVNRKWVIGGDPDDATLVETTATQAYADKGTIALLPTDHMYFFKSSQRPVGIYEIAKYKWVPNGVSELQISWGDEGYFTYNPPEFSTEYHGDLVIVEGKDDILAINQDFTVGTVSELIYCDIQDGTETTRVDLQKWWVKMDEGALGAQACGGPLYMGLGPNGMVGFGAHTNCMNQVIDPYRDGETGGEIDDITLWVNQNGDYVGDHNFQADSKLPWVCFDYNVAPYKYNLSFDANAFSIFPSYDLGAVSFGLFAPDGTGIDYFAYNGETSVLKYGNHFVDYGSPYDGIYTDNNSADADKAGFWYVAHDSFRGIITNQVAVSENGPVGFSVDQNVPNPFNPSTSIRFTIPESGAVSINVFNVAGQKVGTIADGFMSSGSHSVVWDAPGLSAGIYFYTVKSGDYSKTMKMTLLK